MSETDKKKSFFFQVFFFSICSNGQAECRFGNPAENFSTKDQKCFLHCPERIKFFFHKNKLSSKDSCGHVVFSFAKLIVIFFDKSQKLFHSLSKKDRKFFFQQEVFSLKYSFGQVKCNCDNPAEIFWPEGRKLFSQGAKLIEKMKMYLLQKFIFAEKIPADTRNSVLTTPLKKFWQMAKNVSLIFGKWLEKISFQK